MRLTILLALLPTLALAQSPTLRPEDLGTVTGHITCADTQRPARLAGVGVRMANILPSRTPSANPNYLAYLPNTETDLNGNYTIRNVPPGTYYLHVRLPGYIVPELNFTYEQLLHPTPEIQQRIQQELQIITVAPNSTLHADVTLYRGASISGTVTYEDGSPAINFEISMLRRGSSGGSDPVPATVANTDGHGRYSFEALSPGDYIVVAQLGLSSEKLQPITLPNGTSTQMVVNSFAYRLPIYLGNVFRLKDAKHLKIEAGEGATDADITIPISQLHEVSGNLLAKDGHTINAGNVSLLLADDRSQFATVEVNNDAFGFPYVPEGNYILTVQNARDVNYSLTFNGTIPPTRTAIRTVRTYGALEQPLTVTSDIQSLNLTVPDKPTPTAPSQ